jgi:uncharacterized protein (TIGR03000 family)
MCQPHFTSKIWFAAMAMLALPLAAAKGQTYDTFEVLRLQDRTIYIYPRGYAPNLAVPFAPVVNPWYVPSTYLPTAFTAPFAAAPGILPENTVAPLSYTGSTGTLAAPASTSITLRVPEDAEVWIQGKKMDQKGAERRFDLPALDSRTTYDYEVRVAWTQNGKKKSDTSRLSVRAGDQQSVTYIAALATNKTNSGDAIREEPATGK